MGKVIKKRLSCLSLDKDNEQYNGVKAFSGDFVRLLLSDGSTALGIIVSIKNDSLSLKTERKAVTILFNNINDFEVLGRGKSKAYFR